MEKTTLRDIIKRKELACKCSKRKIIAMISQRRDTRRKTEARMKKKKLY